MLPEVCKVDKVIIQRNFQQIKQDVEDLIESQMQQILNDSGKESLLVKK